MRSRRSSPLDADALWQLAVRVLSVRACSAGELRQKLRARAAQVSDVDATISRLKDCGYLDDRRFAESFAASRLDNNQLGRNRVLRDLRQRRVAPTVAEKAVQNLYETVNETELIESYIRRKYRLAPRDKLFQDEKDLAAAYRRLLRAGFSSGNIVRCLKKFAKDPGLLDDFEPPETIEEEP